MPDGWAADSPPKSSSTVQRTEFQIRPPNGDILGATRRPSDASEILTLRIGNQLRVAHIPRARAHLPYMTWSAMGGSGHGRFLPPIRVLHLCRFIPATPRISSMASIT